MKRLLSLFLVMLVLTGCAADRPVSAPAGMNETMPAQEKSEEGCERRFSSETLIELSDSGIKTRALSVFTTNDIVYYEDKDYYESGYPYGEGEAGDKHTAEEAAAHTVVNITKPGAYRVTGKLSAGQIRVDLGDDAYDNENAVVELILDNADITCTVAPAILFLNVYECDGEWDKDNATPYVDTSTAGANLILEGENTVKGSYVARIYKDKKGEKKLWKQDGAIYSYMSMNISGTGSMELAAENEGIDTELHLTINSGDITIRSGNDGINTNEDGVSVTTINGGNLHILAGLGAEGDGIDSNGYLVIYGGNVFSAAHPAADAGLDSDLGSFIHGGTVLALGSAMDWAESESGQVTMNLQYASYRAAGEKIVVTKEDGTEVFSYDPAYDTALGDNGRKFMGAIISSPDLKQGESYLVYTGGEQMVYTGTDVRRGHGGFRGEMPDNAPPEGFDGRPPEDFNPDERKEPLKDFEGKRPDRFGGQPPEEPDGRMPPWPEGEVPEEFDREKGTEHFGKMEREGSAVFYMQDKVNCFSGLTAGKQ